MSAPPVMRRPGRAVSLETMSNNPFRYFNISPGIIQFGVLMYVRFPRSLRNVEDVFDERGIGACHESVRLWATDSESALPTISVSGGPKRCSSHLPVNTGYYLSSARLASGIRPYQRCFFGSNFRSSPPELTPCYVPPDCQSSVSLPCRSADRGSASRGARVARSLPQRVQRCGLRWLL